MASLHNINILIADADTQIARVTNEMLRSMGFTSVRTATSGGQALKAVTECDIDLLITDWKLHRMDGISLVSLLRKDVGNEKRILPVIMLTARAEKQDIETARDIGITEFVVKPFTAQIIFSRIQRLFDTPRDFLLTSTFIGPNRRRKGNSYTEDKRIIRPIPTSSKASDDLGAPRIIGADYALKKKAGITGSIVSIITPAILGRAQQTIDDIKEVSHRWIEDSITSMMDSYYIFVQQRNPLSGEELSHALLGIKSRAGIFGVHKLSEIAQLTYHFLRFDYKHDHAPHNVVLDKLMQSIPVVFVNEIKRTNDTDVSALSSELKKLVQKYA